MADLAGTRPPLISLSRRGFMAAIAGGLLVAPLTARPRAERVHLAPCGK